VDELGAGPRRIAHTVLAARDDPDGIGVDGPRASLIALRSVHPVSGEVEREGGAERVVESLDASQVGDIDCVGRGSTAYRGGERLGLGGVADAEMYASAAPDERARDPASDEPRRAEDREARAMERVSARSVLRHHSRRRAGAAA
jgi:hypothetical protein